jgi:hypothetical protein
VRNGKCNMMNGGLRDARLQGMENEREARGTHASMVMKLVKYKKCRFSG